MAEEIARANFFYRISDGAWLMAMMSEQGSTVSSVSTEMAEGWKAVTSAEYGFPVEMVEFTNLSPSELEALMVSRHWGGKPPDKPYVDYNAPERLFPPSPPPSMQDQDAYQRMVRGYGQLLETERALRAFIDRPLTNHYKTKLWLLHACADEAYQKSISERKREDYTAWLDVLDDSETRFLDFDHIRQLIHANQPVFSGLLPNVRQFERLLLDMKDIRNRIGHVNTLSDGDVEDFDRMCRRVMAIIRPPPRR